uniref:Uncharacterized protein n=1 Tax=Candidatus Kentrum sp. FM TaxID=2126340 RepID=A0A450RU16_9GAMM|nr:MAG: hypothetical protein BECKFM1743A_GA0114220_1000112 [Candidatus Kentron sp. FM]VFJ43346.1 MAG: hypothetical protein BECKFM1743C_GA0114222_1000112 [Candidatus Kentron sp. FM]VFK05504.1 MAG: hypothetical protein BECKFM1743B_GA0114221_1000112 [Candidatus Kentron sp. FM]
MVGIHAWIDTQRKAVCAPSLEEKRFHEIVEYIYPRMISDGYEVPLSVVTDLVCLYDEGPDLGLHPPANPSVSKELLEPYCQRLNQALDQGQGQWRRMLTQTRKALPEKEKDRALLVFLEQVLGLFGKAKEVSLSSEARAAWQQPITYERNRRSSVSVADAEEHLRGFFKVLMGEIPGNNKTSEDSKEPKPDSGANSELLVSELLTVATARVPVGAEGLDLALLSECLAYRPLDLTDEQPAHYERLRQTLAPVRRASYRSPEYGNHGITQKGKISAVLRSYLAREDFIERWVRGELLYYQRHAPELEPHRALLVWVVERSLAMRARIHGTGPRRDRIALRLAAYTLEDALRYFYHFPALEIEVLVLLHNGEQGSKLKGRYIQPPPRVLESVPDIQTTGNEHQVWLSRVDGFLPYWFLREPHWPNSDKNQPMDPFREISTDGSSVRWALASVPRLAERSDYTERGDHKGFDLCHVALFTADAPRLDDLRQPLARAAARTSVALFMLAKEHAYWLLQPSHEPLLKKVDYADYGVETELQRAYWDGLIQQLSSLR